MEPTQIDRESKQPQIRIAATVEVEGVRCKFGFALNIEFPPEITGTIGTIGP